MGAWLFGGPLWLVGVMSVVGIAGAGAVARGPAGVEEGAHRLMRMRLEVVCFDGLVSGDRNWMGAHGPLGDLEMV